MKYLTLILTLILIACIAWRSESGRPLRFVCWELTSVLTHKHDTTRYMSTAKPFLVIKDSVFYGNSGCNDFVGRCAVRGDSVVFGNASATKQGCAAIRWIEHALFRNLMRRSAKYVIKGDSLFLYASNSGVYKFYKRAPKLCTCNFSEE
jgi:heat shock protein HslJ